MNIHGRTPAEPKNATRKAGQRMYGVLNWICNCMICVLLVTLALKCYEYFNPIISTLEELPILSNPLPSEPIPSSPRETITTKTIPIDALCYARRYIDLQEPFCGGQIAKCDIQGLALHYNNIGKQQNRTFGCEMKASDYADFTDNNKDNRMYCMLVRTYIAQEPELITMLNAIDAAFMKNAYFNYLKIFIINTDSKRFDQSQEMIDDVITKFSTALDPASRMLVHLNRNNRPDPSRYGYYVTSDAMDHILNKEDCMYITITNGDNLYSNMYLIRVGDLLQETEYDMVSWAFVSHYPRLIANSGSDEPLAEQVLDGHFKVNRIDLGAALIKADVFRAANYTYRQAAKGPQKHAIHDADWKMFQHLLAVPDVTTYTMPNVLFAHQ